MSIKDGITILIIQTSVCAACFAQTGKIDSLRRLLTTLKDTARIECLHALGVECLCERDDSAAYYTNRLFEESKKLNYMHGIATAYVQKAILAGRSNDPIKKLQLAFEAINWYSLTPNKTEIEYAYNQVAQALFDQFKYEEAIPYMDRWYYWAEKNRNKDAMYGVFGFKYENYRDIGDYEKAFDAFEKTQQLNQRFDGKKDEWYENYVLAELQRRLGNYSVALSHYRKVVASMNLNNNTNIWFRVSYPELFALDGQIDSAEYYYGLIDPRKLNQHDLRFYLVSIGEFYILKNRFADAVGHLLRGLEYHRQAKDVSQENRALIDLAKAYNALKQNDAALLYARQGLDLSLQSHSKQYIRDVYEILYEIYQRKNQVDSAFAYYQKYIAQKELVANDIVKGKFAAYNYDQRIASLNAEKILQHQQLNREKTNRNILIAALIVGLLLAAFIIRNIQLKRRKDQLQHLMTEANTQLENRRKEQQLAEIQQQKTELEMQALRAQMNPHFIFNSLNSINMFILENNKLQASEYLSKFSRLVRLILQNSQEAFIPLERELDALQLYLELESLRFDKKFEYKISLSNEIDTTVLKVPPLIVQPYAENAIWHGLMHMKDKGHLEIEFYKQENILFCKITDDGIGRNQASQMKGRFPTGHKSIGMRITADRIAMMQQKNQSDIRIEVKDLVLADGTPGGTEVLLKIPVTDLL